MGKSNRVKTCWAEDGFIFVRKHWRCNPIKCRRVTNGVVSRCDWIKTFTGAYVPAADVGAIGYPTALYECVARPLTGGT
jgi:hypothetical protein